MRQYFTIEDILLSKVRSRATWIEAHEQCLIDIGVRGVLQYTQPESSVILSIQDAHHLLMRIFSTRDGFLSYTEGCKACDNYLITRDNEKLSLALRGNPYESTLKTFLTRIIEAINGGSKIKHFRMFFLWWKRVNAFLPERSTLYETYMSDEDRISDLNADIRAGGESELIDSLRKICFRFLPVTDADIKNATPKFSNGVTSEIRKRENSIDNKIELMRALDYAPFLPQEWLFYDHSKVETPLSSRLVSVAKGFGKLRLISPEPTVLQFYQQGVLDIFRHFMSAKNRKSTLGKHVLLEDQRQNREMCHIGAVTHDFMTIDLKSASDSISWELVKRLLFGHPLGRLIFITRSKYVDLSYFMDRGGPSGPTLHRLAKCSPMGSAVCFPIESLIFASICELTQKEMGFTESSRYRVRKDLFNEPVREYIPMYSVYGDDIVLHASLVEGVLDKLSRLGFIVNYDKTCLTGDYRESCGVEYLLDEDVTPLTFSRSFPVLNRDAFNTTGHCSDVEALRALCNACLDFGYFGLRRSLIRFVRSLKKPLSEILFSRDDRYWLGYDCDNKHLLHVYHPGYQSLLRRHGITVYRQGYSSPLHENEEKRYYYWLYCHARSVAIERIDSFYDSILSARKVDISRLEARICRPPRTSRIGMRQPSDQWTYSPLV